MQVVAGTGMQHNTMWRHLDALVQVCKVLLLPQVPAAVPAQRVKQSKVHRNAPELNAYTATAPTSPALQLPRLECR